MARILFVVMLLLLRVGVRLGVRLGLAGSAMGLLLVSVLGGFLSKTGHGPFALMQAGSLYERDFIFQGFVATSMLMLYV
jgi:hypothetical protein